MRHGDWMQTYSGRKFWPVDPRPEEVFIEDIAHALSMICRFGGHSLVFYSVAQHSVLVARNLRREHKRWGLMHDASESYVMDIPRPLKYFIPGYKGIENNVMRAISLRYGLGDMPADIKRVDNAILADEMSQLMAPPPEEWHLPEPPLGINIKPWGPKRAKTEFMKEFTKLFS